MRYAIFPFPLRVLIVVAAALVPITDQIACDIDSVGAVEATPDARTNPETVGGWQRNGKSRQSSELERHWQAVAEIEELGGKVTVQGAGSLLRTSVHIGGQPVPVGSMRVGWQGGSEKLVELLRDLINVRSLRTSRYEIDDAELAQLRDILSGLEELVLHGSRLTDDGLVNLRPSRRLTLLRLDDCDVTDEGLDHLKGLTELRLLSLQRTNITGAGLSCLAGLRNLETLFLEGTRVDDEGLAHLKALTSLTRLQLDSTDVHGVGLVYLSELPNLTNLYLCDTQVTDDGLEHLKGMMSLEWLWLADTNITDAGLVHFRDLKNLQRLYLEGCQITGPGLAHLAELPRLEKLNLTRVPTTENVLEQLGKLTSLHELTLSSDHVTPEGETELKRLLRNCRVSIIRPRPDRLRWGDIPHFVGRRALPLDVATWINSEAVTLEELTGKIVVLAFWDSADESPTEVIQGLNILAEKHPDMAIIAVHSAAGDQGTLRELVARENVTFRVALDKPSSRDYPGATFKRYKAQNPPSVYIIDTHGTVRYQDIALAVVEEAIKQLLDQQ